MPTSTISSSMIIGGIALSSAVTRTQEGQIGVEEILIAGSDGDMATYDSGSGCTVDMAVGHVVASGTVDVYWLESSAQKVRYGATAVLVTDTVTLSLGAGDDYPNTVGLDMVITNQQDIEVDFDADTVELMAATCDRLAHIEWDESGPTTITGTKLLAGEAWTYLKNGEYANALDGKTVSSISATTGDSDNDGILRLGILYSAA